MKNDAIKELETYANKKKVYEVLNPFEMLIDNYNDSISEKGKKYFENVNQINNDFCKLWEMFFMFDLIDLESDLFSCHLGNTKGFAESTDFYKKLFGKSKNDKQYNSDDKITEKLNFITANYSTDIFLNNVEQEFYKDIINFILFTIKNQKKDGTFVLKLSETYTNVSQKIITMIASLYNRVYLCKPLTSRPSDAEKFIIAQGFKYTDSDSKLKDIQSSMEKIKNKMENNENNNKEIDDIFTEYVIDPEMKVRLTQFNNLIENKQFKAIGQILTFVSTQNFYGDIYQKAREEQIEAAKFWTELFLMPNAEYKQNKAKINDMSYLSNKINLEGSLELKKKLIY